MVSTRISSLKTNGAGWWTTLRRAMGVLAALCLVVSAAAQAPQAVSTGAGAVPAARFAKNVVIITIDRPIDRVLATSVQRRLEAAVESKADAVVIELDTPGGEVGAVLDITKMIKTSPIPNTVAWVNTNAYSGGAIIAIACREIVVSDLARLGDAAPISPFGSLEETERQKILAPLLADVVHSARKRGWDEKLVQGMMTLGVELWMIENTKTGERLFIDRGEYRILFGEPPAAEPLSLASGAPAGAPAKSAPVEGELAPQLETSGPPETPSGSDFIPATPTIHEETRQAASLALTIESKRPKLTPEDAAEWKLIEKVSDGTSIFTFSEAQLMHYGLATAQVRNDEELKAFFGASNMRRLDESWSELLVVFLTNLIVRGILVVIFLVSIFIEMTHPGVIIPGVVAVCALVLLIAPPMLNNMASWWEIAAMLLGVLLLVMEFFVIPGFGVCGVAGIVLFLAGLVGTFIGDGSGGLFPDSPGAGGQMMSGVTTVALSVITAIAVMWFLGKHFGSIPLLNRLVLQDASGDGDSETGLLAAMVVSSGPVVAGSEGVALTPLRPAGRVQIGDEIVDVVSDFGFIPSGAKVRVVAIEQFRITVEPVAPRTARGGDAGGGTGSGGASA